MHAPQQRGERCLYTNTPVEQCLSTQCPGVAYALYGPSLQPADTVATWPEAGTAHDAGTWEHWLSVDDEGIMQESLRAHAPCLRGETCTHTGVLVERSHTIAFPRINNYLFLAQRTTASQQQQPEGHFSNGGAFEGVTTSQQHGVMCSERSDFR